MFRKGKPSIIAKFYGTDLVICSRSKEGKTPSYSRINTVNVELLVRSNLKDSTEIRWAGSNNVCLRRTIQNFIQEL